MAPAGVTAELEPRYAQPVRPVDKAVLRMAHGSPRQKLRLPLALALVIVLGLGATETRAGSDPMPAAPDLDSAPDMAAVLAAGQRARPSEIAPGLSYRIVEVPKYGLKIHLWAFDRARVHLRTAVQTSETGNTIEAFVGGPDDVLAVNGGFFEKDGGDRLSPSGLLIIGGKQVAPEHDRAGSGILYEGRSGIAIAYRQSAPDRNEMRSALQAGPILVEPDGRSGIRSSKNDKRYDRTAVCLRGDSVLVIVVEGGLTLLDLAQLLSTPQPAGGIGCNIAISLDGGGSTQALFRSGNHRLLIPGQDHGEQCPGLLARRVAGPCIS